MEEIQLSDANAAVTTWRIPNFSETQPVLETQHEPQSDLIELSQAASEEGYEAGYEAGRLEGLRAGREEIALAVAQFNALADAMTRPFIDFDQQVVNELRKIVYAVVNQVVRQEVATDPDIVNKLVETALSMLSTIEGDAEVILNPADISRVRTYLTEFHQQGGWRLSEDESLAQGGCIVKTPVSYIDMSLQKQITVALEQLQESNQGGYEPDGSARAQEAGPAEQTS